MKITSGRVSPEDVFCTKIGLLTVCAFCFFLRFLNLLKKLKCTHCSVTENGYISGLLKPIDFAAQKICTLIRRHDTFCFCASKNQGANNFADIKDRVL